jgi:hypothetical protein
LKIRGTATSAINLAGGAVTTPSGGTIRLIGDAMNLSSGAINAGSSSVTLLPATNGTLINLGGADATGTLVCRGGGDFDWRCGANLDLLSVVRSKSQSQPLCSKTCWKIRPVFSTATAPLSSEYFMSAGFS